MGKIVETIEMYDDEGNLLSIDKHTTSGNTVRVCGKPINEWKPDEEDDEWEFDDDDDFECDCDWERELADQLAPYKNVAKAVGVTAACLIGGILFGKLIKAVRK